MNDNNTEKEKETINITLPCNHVYRKKSFISMAVSQICIYKKVYCIECSKPYITDQTEIILYIYKLIQIEKNKLKDSLKQKNLNESEKKILINYRKDFFINILKNTKKKLEHMDIILEMFNIIFETIYII